MSAGELGCIVILNVQRECLGGGERRRGGVIWGVKRKRIKLLHDGFNDGPTTSGRSFSKRTRKKWERGEYEPKSRGRQRVKRGAQRRDFQSRLNVVYGDSIFKPLIEKKEKVKIGCRPARKQEELRDSRWYRWKREGQKEE